ncbi:MAG TPA: haloacid dehalogenase type II [Coleofasciculaceae cyanobacterium]|jgi:2-haloacid dehalogenase
MLNFDQYQVLTFDCYGTLIDWESGMLNALRKILEAHSIQLEDEKILELFAEFESTEEKDYKSYREVLKGVVRRFGDRLQFQPSAAEQEALPNSIQHWQPFPDTVEALKQLKQRFKLVIISNVDDDLFAGTAPHLQVELDQVITAQQVKSYKPSLNNFQVAFDRIGLPQDQILHVAASLYHDIVPANTLELANVWVNRRLGMTGSGAAMAAIAQPSLEVPNLRVLADLIAD